jgi:hypothetical protein
VQGEEISLVTLRKAGVSQGTIERTIVVLFGCAESAFEALAPQTWVVNGEPKPVTQLGRAFK